MDIGNEPPGAYGDAADGSRWVAAAMLVKQIVRDELGAVAARVKRLAAQALQTRYGMTATTGTTGHGLADLTGAARNVVRAAGETGSGHSASDRSVPQRRPFDGATAATAQDLDADLAAWLEPAASRPRIGVLGEVRVEAPGQPPADRQSFYAEIAVLLAVMGTRGVSAAELEGRCGRAGRSPPPAAGWR